MINTFAMTRRARLVLSAALLVNAIACGGNAPAPEEEHEELAMNDGRVTLTDAAMRAADIRTALVGDEAVASEGGLVAPGAVELDPRRVAVISSRVDGRLERLNAVAGDAVEAAYRRGDMFDRRRALMADWAAYCAS